MFNTAANDPADTSFNDEGDWRIPPSKWAIDPMKPYEHKEFKEARERIKQAMQDLSSDPDPDSLNT